MCIKRIRGSASYQIQKMSFNLLYILEPISKLVPSIAKPVGIVSMSQKTVFTAIALFIYLVCSQIPLYAVERLNSSDPFYWTRVILASSRGTLMELGISPVISAGWMMQFSGLFGIIKADFNSKRDSRIHAGLTKVLALIIAFGEAAGQLWLGAYGQMENLGTFRMSIIVAQLLMATVITIYLDELLEAGYGLGSGISLFIAANTAETIFWKVFSPITQSSEMGGVQFQGSLICLVHFLLTKPSAMGAVYQSFRRESAPNLSSLSGTILIFFIVIYLQRIKMTLPFIHQTSRGFKYQYNIKLFFTSSMGVILQSMVASKIYELSSLLYSRFSNVFFIRLLGVWENEEVVGGLSWWISPPKSAWGYVEHPLRGVTYISFVVFLCGIFGQIWLAVSKETPRQLTKRFRDQELTLEKFRQQSTYSALNRYVPTAAMLGGMIIGLLTVLGDLLDVIGSSTGILISANILYGFYDQLSQQNKSRSVSFY